MTCHDTLGFMAKVKFSSKIEASTLRELRSYAKDSKLSIADILSEAVAQHLHLVRVRPAFRAAVEESIAENAELYERLAK